MDSDLGPKIGDVTSTITMKYLGTNLAEKYKSYKNSSEFKGLTKLYALRNYFCPGYILSGHVVLVLRLPKVRCDATVWKSLNVCQGYQNFTYSKDTRV